jgi:thiamine-monophosphate kinase
MDSAYLKRLELGMKKCLDRYGVKVIGGDLKKGRELVLTGIAIGEVDRPRMMQRMNMKKGEVLCVTGSLGGPAAGHYLWKNGRKGGQLAMLNVEPKIREGKFLAANGCRAAIDLSDGVYSAIRQISSATGLGFEIDYASLPINPLARKVNEKYGIDIEQLCLNFGGEYELMFTLSASKFEGVRKKAARLGIRISRIGTVTKSGSFIVKDGKRTRIKKYGYEHFITD